MKEREAGFHKTGSLWDQARKDVITESTKSRMLHSAAARHRGNVTAVPTDPCTDERDACDTVTVPLRPTEARE